MKMKTQLPECVGHSKGGPKFTAMSTYTKRTERSEISDLMLHLKLLEIQEQANPKTSRRREIRVELMK
jgi:hypothetical protein